MKKLFVVLLAVVMIFAGCTEDKSSQVAPAPTVQQPVQTPSPAPAPTPTNKPEQTRTPERDESLLNAANFLTPVLVLSMDTLSAPANPDFSEATILFSIAYKESPEYYYKDIFPLVDDFNYQFKISEANKVIYQLLGDKEFNAMSYADHLPNGGYNSETDALELSLEFGWVSLLPYHTGDFLYSEFSGDSSQIVSHFELFIPDETADDPDTVSDGNYSLIYDIVTENGETFLRFNRFEKE